MKRPRQTAQVNGEGLLAPIPAEMGKVCSSPSPLISQSPILPPHAAGELYSPGEQSESACWGVWWLSPKEAGA